ncbi:DUF5602 domain-containing protein [Flavisolibacter sp. BT320]|nr:DUF5602 domain-containing protein [Flavisolibacter longurius]
MMRLLFKPLPILLSVFVFSSCNKMNDFLPNGKDKANKLKTYRSTPVSLWEGKATAWISVNRVGVPVELGLEIAPKALDGLPETNFSVAKVPLPAIAKELTPFDHIQIDWASQGHGMPGPTGPAFMGPHYDIRFFMTTLEERMQIPAPTDPTAKFNILPPAGYMPANYFAGRSALPGIGLHWTDGQGFNGMTRAMVLGTYNGEFTFVSPIVTAEELLSGNASSTPFGQPQYFQESNTYYPTTYNIYQDKEGKKHQVTLSGFVLR